MAESEHSSTGQLPQKQVAEIASAQKEGSDKAPEKKETETDLKQTEKEKEKERERRFREVSKARNDLKVGSVSKLFGCWTCRELVDKDPKKRKREEIPDSQVLQCSPWGYELHGGLSRSWKVKCLNCQTEDTQHEFAATPYKVTCKSCSKQHIYQMSKDQIESVREEELPKLLALLSAEE